MATDITKKRLVSKGFQTRRLGGAIPQWEIINPERGYSIGRFGMSAEKEKRLRAKAVALAAQRRESLNPQYINLTPVMATSKRNISNKHNAPKYEFSKVPVASQHFVDSDHGKAVADWHRISEYLSEIGGRINELKKNNQINVITPEELSQITGIKFDRPGSPHMLAAVLAAAEHPELINAEVKRGLSESFRKWHVGGTVNEALGKEVSNLIDISSLTPAVKDWMKAHSEERKENIQKSIETYKNNFEQNALNEEINRRAEKWIKKHGDTAEEGYVEGLLGGDYADKDNPYYQQGQKERVDNSLDEYLGAGKGTPSQKKKAKHKNPDLYEAGFPDGQQTEIPERKLMNEPELNISDIPRPKKPDFSLIINPEEKKQAQQDYDRELDDYEHNVTSRMREGDMIATWNDKIIARNKALKKERQQLLAENTFEDNLKMQRKLLKDKRKEYGKAKYEKSKEKRFLGAHDFWNVIRGNTSSMPDSVGSIGGITSSLAAANQAIQKGPQNFRRI